MNNQPNNQTQEQKSYLCEGGNYCDHGFDSTHWEGKDEIDLRNTAEELDIDQKIDDLSVLENIISIETELKENRFNYVILDPRSEEIPDYNLGIEITIPKLVKEEIENIDPQHGDNPNLETSAIKEALEYDLNKLPENLTIATLKPDADSIGAMAVLELRKAGIEPDKDLIQYISKFDSYGFKRAKELYPEIEVRQKELTAASQKCLNRTDSIEDKVKWMKKILTGRLDWSEIEEINANWEKQKEEAKKALKIEPIIKEKAILVTGNHPQAFAVGYEQAGIVAAYNPEFTRPWVKDDKPTKKWTIARYSEAEDINIEWLKETLNKMEKEFSGKNYDPSKTWGGPKNLVASPQGYTSAIPKDQILELIKAAVNYKDDNNRECTCGSGLAWHECKGIDGDISYCG